MGENWPDIAYMTLDLTGCTPLSSKNARLLNELAVGLRPHIVRLVDQLSTEQGSNIDWWVTPLASRNPFSSQFFLHCCRILLLDRLLTLKEIPDEVLVDSPAMADLAACLASRHGVGMHIKVRYSRFWHDYLLVPLKSLLTAVFHSVSQFVCARLLLSRPTPYDGSSLILVDTFLYSDSVHNGVFHDRHFPGINDVLEADESARIRYFPTFYKIRNYPKAFFRLHRLRERFLIKEDFLKISDYVYAFGHGFRVRHIRSSAQLSLDGMQLNALVDEELQRGWMWPGAIEALLKFRTVARMREAGVKIGRVLDWFENQDIDRGANAGFRRYYPNAEVVGYIGYVASQHYLCMYPTPAEAKAQVLPTKFAVMGKGFVSSIKEFCPELVATVSPALRYSAGLQLAMRSAHEPALVVVVALPLVRAEALAILNTIHHLLHSLQKSPLAAEEGVHFRIKPHPSSDISAQGAYGLPPDSKIRVTWENGKLDTLLQQSDVLVSAASSACFEALAMGVPVIIQGSLMGITFVPIPQAVPEGQWQVCYAADELLAALETIQQRRSVGLDNGRDIAYLLQEKYLEPVNKEGVRRLVLGGDNP